MVRSMTAALVQARFVIPGFEPISACSARLRTEHSCLCWLCVIWIYIATCLLFVHWVLTGHCSKLQPTVATCLLLAYWVLTGHCSKLQHTVCSCLPLIGLGLTSATDLVHCKVLYTHTWVFPRLVTVVSHSIPDLLHFLFPVDLPVRHGSVRRSYIWGREHTPWVWSAPCCPDWLSYMVTGHEDHW